MEAAAVGFYGNRFPTVAVDVVDVEGIDVGSFSLSSVWVAVVIRVYLPPEVVRYAGIYIGGGERLASHVVVSQFGGTDGDAISRFPSVVFACGVGRHACGSGY